MELAHGWSSQNNADAKNSSTQGHPQRIREDQGTFGVRKSVKLQGIAKAVVAAGRTRE
jgi:hypothetical protein